MLRHASRDAEVVDEKEFDPLGKLRVAAKPFLWHPPIIPEDQKFFLGGGLLEEPNVLGDN